MTIFPSVWTGYFEELTIEQALERLVQAGFAHTELCIDHAEQLLERGKPEKVGAKLTEFAADLGMSISQGHLTFAKGLCDPEALEYLKRELELFAAVGIQNAVVHFSGGSGLSPEAKMAKRMEGLRVLADFVKGSNVTLCLENLHGTSQTYTVEHINGILDAIGGENLGICLDTGHLHYVNGLGQARQTQREFIMAAGKRLRALHITENNGKNDVHQMPYSARYGIDWADVVAALRQVGYHGLFNLEILGECNAPEPIKTAKLHFIRKMTRYMLED